MQGRTRNTAGGLGDGRSLASLSQPLLEEFPDLPIMTVLRQLLASEHTVVDVLGPERANRESVYLLARCHLAELSAQRVRSA